MKYIDEKIKKIAENAAQKATQAALKGLKLSGIPDALEQSKNELKATSEAINANITKLNDTFCETKESVGKEYIKGKEKINDRIKFFHNRSNRVCKKAKSSFFKTYLSSASGKLSSVIAKKLGSSPNIADFTDYATTAVVGALYDVKKCTPDALMVRAASFLLCPLFEKGFETYGLSPAKTLAIITTIRTAADIYVDPVEGLSEVAGSYIGNSLALTAANLTEKAADGLCNRHFRNLA